MKGRSFLSLPRIYTIGHSHRSWEELVDLLRSQAILRLADVRRFPGSRRHPQFAGASLSESLPAAGILYRHYPALGGFRRERPDSPHRAWDEGGFRAYADHMETVEFSRGLGHLERLAMEATVAIMCAEASPYQCHRLLLSDALLRDRFPVLHILEAGKTEEHVLPSFARLEGKRIIYDGGTLPLQGR